MPHEDANKHLGPSNKVRSSEFINRSDKFYHKVLKECITHHCRTCQYYWDSGILNVVNDTKCECKSDKKCCCE